MNYGLATDTSEIELMNEDSWKREADSAWPSGWKAEDFNSHGDTNSLAPLGGEGRGEGVDDAATSERPVFVSSLQLSAFSSELAADPLAAADMELGDPGAANASAKAADGGAGEAAARDGAAGGGGSPVGSNASTTTPAAEAASSAFGSGGAAFDAGPIFSDASSGAGTKALAAAGGVSSLRAAPSGSSGGSGGGVMNPPHFGPCSSNPSVSIAATDPYASPAGAPDTGTFTLTFSHCAPSNLTVNFTVTGTAASGGDYVGIGTSITIGSGNTTGTITITPIEDFFQEQTPETVIVTLGAGTGYTIGSPSMATVSIIDDDATWSGMPANTPVIPDCGCSGGLALVAPDSNSGGHQIRGVSKNPVRYFDGTVSLNETELSSGGFGVPWSHTRSWSNGTGYTAISINGNGWVTDEQPYLRQADLTNNHVVLIENGLNARYFDLVGSVYYGRFFQQATLTYDSINGVFTLSDTSGRQTKFFDFNTSLPANKRGTFKSLSDPDGNLTLATSWDTNGKITEVQRTSGSGMSQLTESFLYTYITSGVNVGLLSNVTVRRKVGTGSWTTIRQVDYTYYDGTQSYGNAGDLMKGVLKDSAGNALDTRYYRYYTTESGGYTHALKYVFEPQSYARLAAAFANPTTATDAQVAPYADDYFVYDASKRITSETVQGEGCSSCTGGQGTFTFAYSTSTNANSWSNWTYKTVETLPDNNQNIVYTNYVGEVILSVFHDVTSGNNWIEFNKFDGRGRAVLHAEPSAVTGYDETKADLLNSQSGNYQYLSDSSGLIEDYVYGSSTTATSSSAGNVLGYLQDVKIQKGETGTAIEQSNQQYFAQTGASTIYPVATSTVYRNTDGTGGETTSYSYTFFTGTTQVQSVTVTNPVIGTSQNGPGGTNADTQTTFLDSYARPIWTKDGDGFLNYIAYDQVTGALTKTITDVDTTRTGDFQNLPTGWTTPSGGGLHLITSFIVDGLGRPTKITDPIGDITYIVYNDTNYEVRTYPGWNTSTNKPTGPTIVQREDRPNSYYENLTMTATPTVSGGVPTGQESVSSVQTLSRTYISNGGQVSNTDQYFNLSGLTYSTSPNIGTENTNFYRTRYAYDEKGRRNYVKLPTGTIQRTVYDSRDRVLSNWIGTNDNGATDTDPTGGGATGNNMIKVSDNQYDGGGVGDSTLTQTTQYPGGSAANRVTQFFFDWRDRLVATKIGYEASESTSLNRPIYYTEYDNLSEATAQEQYDGDGVTIADSNNDGVPDKPSSSLLRARSTTSFDDQMRVYKQQTFSVDQSTGSISSNSLNTNNFYNHRGQLIKTSAPGGIVSKMVHDGAGRQTKSYTTDGGGDTGWSDASNVTGDAVLSETITTYDADSNPILVTTKDASTTKRRRANWATRARVPRPGTPISPTTSTWPTASPTPSTSAPTAAAPTPAQHRRRPLPIPFC